MVAFANRSVVFDFALFWTVSWVCSDRRALMFLESSTRKCISPECRYFALAGATEYDRTSYSRSAYRGVAVRDSFEDEFHSDGLGCHFFTPTTHVDDGSDESLH